MSAKEGSTGSGDEKKAPPPQYKPANEVICAAEKDQCEAIDKKKVKTVLCVNYMHGKRCKYGTHCAFAHGEDELRDCPPEMLERKREIAEQQAKKQEERGEEGGAPPPYEGKVPAPRAGRGGGGGGGSGGYGGYGTTRGAGRGRGAPPSYSPYANRPPHYSSNARYYEEDDGYYNSRREGGSGGRGGGRGSRGGRARGRGAHDSHYDNRKW